MAHRREYPAGNTADTRTTRTFCGRKTLKKKKNPPGIMPMSYSVEMRLLSEGLKWLVRKKGSQKNRA